MIGALRANHSTAQDSAQPVFVGEFGPQQVTDPRGIAAHAGLWASLMSGDAGAAQFWSWDAVEHGDFYGVFAAASGFVRASGLAGRDGLRQSVPAVETAERADLGFGAGGGFGGGGQNEFEVTAQGAPAGAEKLSPYLQGDNNRHLMPKPLVFRVNYARAGQFRVLFSQISRNGAHPKLSMDGQSVEADFPARDKDYEPALAERTLQVAVPAGAHTVTLENSGKDWAQIKQFVLSDYASALGAYALSGPDFLAGWVYQRANILAEPEKLGASTIGQFALTGLRAGQYRATWWNTQTGQPISSEPIRVGAQGAVLQTPAVTRDVALFVAPLAG